MILEIMGTNYLRGVVSSYNLSENTPPPATLGCNNSHTTTGGVSTDIQHKKGGFTLVELSIVLIIIGLIVGGVLGGQSLIKSAELQRVVNEFRQYETALNAFRLEFNATPGDMNNAFDYWGTSCADGKEATCNGNGDGGVDDDHEEFNVAHHLSLAGIFPGAFKGFQGQGGNKFKAGLDIPLSKLSGDTGYQFEMPCTYPIGCSHHPVYAYSVGGKHRIALWQGDYDSSTKGALNWQSSLTPKQALQIDTKIDDGLPLFGHYVTFNWLDDRFCLSDTSVSPSVKVGNALTYFTDANIATKASKVKYNVSNTEKHCGGFYVMGF